MLTKAPVKESRVTNSITLSWLPWRQPPDLGDGPVNRYKVYYKHRWRNVGWTETESTDQLRVVITNLLSRTPYQFKVAPLHEQGFEGRPSPAASIMTCGCK